VFSGIKITPQSTVNFAAGSVKYVVNIQGQRPVSYELIAKEYHELVLDGYYADSDVLYSEKTGKLYISYK
jgi:arabinoxylan arabinofuranohydrolase